MVQKNEIKEKLKGAKAALDSQSDSQEQPQVSVPQARRPADERPSTPTDQFRLVPVAEYEPGDIIPFAGHEFKFLQDKNFWIATRGKLTGTDIIDVARYKIPDEDGNMPVLPNAGFVKRAHWVERENGSIYTNQGGWKGRQWAGRVAEQEGNGYVFHMPRDGKATFNKVEEVFPGDEDWWEPQQKEAEDTGTVVQIHEEDEQDP